jgi:hypothetical protein
MKWKKLALEMYFKLYSRRCVLCSNRVETVDAHIEIRDKEYFLMHKLCKTQEEEGCLKRR